MEIMFYEVISAYFSAISKVRILIYAIVKFEQDLFRITDFLAFSNHATKGKLNGKISLLRFFFVGYITMSTYR